MSGAAIKPCPHCNGTGVVEPPNPKVRGNALGKLPPYGREVEQAAHENRLPRLGVALFFKAEPETEARPGPHPDAWAMAKAMNAGHPGSAMVLPLDRQVKDFRWPEIPCLDFAPQIAFWAYDCTVEEQTAIGRALIEAGYDHVTALGGIDGPVQFKAAG